MRHANTLEFRIDFCDIFGQHVAALQIDSAVPVDLNVEERGRDHRSRRPCIAFAAPRRRD